MAVTAGEEAADARAAAQLLDTLHRPLDRLPDGVPDGAQELAWRFDRAEQWLAEGRAQAAVSPAELAAARTQASELHADATRVLCHGDLLDKNILLDGDGRWRAIDPMPCLGDPCLDAAFWALHHRPGVGVRERCERVAGHAGLPGARVWRWARALAATEAVLDIGAGRAAGHLRTLREL